MWPSRRAARGGVTGMAGDAHRVYRCPFCDTYHTTKSRRGKPGKG